MLSKIIRKEKKKDDLVKRLKKASEQGFAGAGGYGKHSLRNLLNEAVETLENSIVL